MPTTTPRAIALIRCSTDKQDLDHQRRAVTRWATANGIPLDIREEMATSGAAVSRPVLDQVLAACRSGAFDVLVVPAIDRISRRAIGAIQVMAEMKQLGVRVVSLREGVDFSTPAGALVASVMAHVAEMELEAHRDRTRSGLRAAKARGKVLGRPAFDWQAAVAEIRALVADGKSLRQIEREKLVKVFSKRGKGRAVVPSASGMAKALKRFPEPAEVSA